MTLNKSDKTQPRHETVADRLRHIMSVRGMSQRRLAALLRIDPSNLSKALNGRLPFTEGLVNRIVVDLGVSKPWLRDGIGLPFDKEPVAKEIMLGEEFAPAPVRQGTPVYELDVTAGCRSLEALFGETKPVGTVDIPGIPEDSRIVQVRGDSMCPRIINGGFVAVRRIKDMRNIFYGQIYVVQLDEFRMVKYVRRHSDPSMVVLHSDNPDYDDMDVARDDIRALYLVEAILNYEVSC